MGTLYLVATPIGNLEDITLRALRILREAPLIAAEDTRHTRKLLSHFEIATPTISYHEHSGPAGIERVLSALASGDVALVSDAGTPAVSDPGEDLVRAAIAAGYPVVPIPGPAAVVSALVASGLPTGEFTFLGFLPRKAAERRARLAAVRDSTATLVLYEAPHRLLATLDDLLATLGDRQAALARELTKLHEEWLRGPLSVLRTHYTSGATPRGEYTLVIAGAEPAASERVDEDARRERARKLARDLLQQGLSTRAVAVQVAEATGLPRREAYRLALELSGSASKSI
jgi:16S rRNA (cytidine1402-2'-O)-methyltransferase